jgi:hypothetical protein
MPGNVPSAMASIGAAAQSAALCITMVVWVEVVMCRSPGLQASN